MTTVPSLIASLLAYNLGVIHMHADDLTQEETIANPTQGGNNMNWILGHIADYRRIMLEYVGLDAPWPIDRYLRFARGSEPLTDPAQASELATVIADLEAAQKLFSDWAATVTDEALAFQKEGARRDVGGQMGWYAWHEAYHIGQLEQLRHAAGRHEALI